MTARTPQSRFNRMLAGFITPRLNREGFRRQGTTYIRTLEGLSWLLAVQRSRWNTRTRLEFTLNCGVFIPGVVSTYTGHCMAKSPSIAECSVYERIGLLGADGLDKWWILEESDSECREEEIGIELQAMIESLALPFLRGLQTA